MANGSAVFLDTSIQIARFVHSPAIKLLIEERLRKYRITVTGLVVRQEFKRRLLKEAKYLLEQLERRGSIQGVMRHVHDVLPRQQDRKRRICLQTLMTVFDREGDSDCTERAKLFLKYLLRGGLREFDELVGHVVQKSGCGCAQTPIRKKKGGRFEFGTDKCSDLRNRCGIIPFLRDNSDSVNEILVRLRRIPDDKKTPEIRHAQQFLDEVSTNVEEAPRRNPCLTVGDLLIALESIGVPVFFTMNGKESQHFCRALQQDLVVRRPNPDHGDVVCSRTDDSWPEF